MDFEFDEYVPEYDAEYDGVDYDDWEADGGLDRDDYGEEGEESDFEGIDYGYGEDDPEGPGSSDLEDEGPRYEASYADVERIQLGRARGREGRTKRDAILDQLEGILLDIYYPGGGDHIDGVIREAEAFPKLEVLNPRALAAAYYWKGTRKPLTELPKVIRAVPEGTTMVDLVRYARLVSQPPSWA